MHSLKHLFALGLAVVMSITVSKAQQYQGGYIVNETWVLGFLLRERERCYEALAQRQLEGRIATLA